MADVIVDFLRGPTVANSTLFCSARCNEQKRDNKNAATSIFATWWQLKLDFIATRRKLAFSTRENMHLGFARVSQIEKIKKRLKVYQFAASKTHEY